ncbi:unnamed protein product [Lampetra planeri]
MCLGVFTDESPSTPPNTNVCRGSALEQRGTRLFSAGSLHCIGDARRRGGGYGARTHEGASVRTTNATNTDTGDSSRGLIRDGASCALILNRHRQPGTPLASAMGERSRYAAPPSSAGPLARPERTALITADPAASRGFRVGRGESTNWGWVFVWCGGFGVRRATMAPAVSGKVRQLLIRGR